MTLKQIKLNKLCNLYNSMGVNTPVELKNKLWWVILDLKVKNKAYFKDLKLFDLLKNDFNIKHSNNEFIIEIK